MGSPRAATGDSHAVPFPSVVLLLLLVAGCFTQEPVLPPHEALAKTAQSIQQIIDEDRRVATKPIQFPQDAPANPGEVVFWFCAHPLISHTILAHPERVETFQSAHPELKLNHQYIGDWSVAIQKLTVSLAAGDVPDVALVKRPWLVRLIDSGWIAPLDDLLPPTLLDDFRPVALAPLKRDGHLYALPADGFCSVLFYNEGKFGTHTETRPCDARDNLAGSRKDDPTIGQDATPVNAASPSPASPGGTTDAPPTTWDELRKCARRLTEPNEDPRRTAYGIGHLPFLETLWSAGGEVCDATKCLLDSDAACEALDFIVSLRTEGFADPRALDDSMGALDLFLSARVAMTVSSSEHLFYTRNAKFPVAIAPVPGKSGPISKQSDNVLVVFAKHAHAKRDAVAAVVDFLTGPAVQDRDAFQDGSAPTRKSVAKDAPVPEGLEAAYNASRNAPLLPTWAAITCELDAGLARCSVR